LVEFTTDVDVCRRGVHRAPSDQAASDELVWVTTHNFTVFANTRLAFIHKVPGSNELTRASEIN
jgi:hypothetical protein